jgi:hypothetical protein
MNFNEIPLKFISIPSPSTATSQCSFGECLRCGRRGGKGAAERGGEGLRAAGEELDSRFPVTNRRRGWGICINRGCAVFFFLVFKVCDGITL